MQTNFEVENNYELQSDIDGFYLLYYRGECIAQIHNDEISRCQASDSWDYDSWVDEYLHRLHIAVGIHESRYDY